MVTGITRQVIVIKGSGEDMFDQAIFLVRDNVLSSGGVTEKELLNEVKQLYHSPPAAHSWKNFALVALGAIGVGILWIISGIIL